MSGALTSNSAYWYVTSAVLQRINQLLLDDFWNVEINVELNWIELITHFVCVMQYRKGYLWQLQI